MYGYNYLKKYAIGAIFAVMAMCLFQMYGCQQAQAASPAEENAAVAVKMGQMLATDLIPAILGDNNLDSVTKGHIRQIPALLKAGMNNTLNVLLETMIAPSGQAVLKLEDITLKMHYLNCSMIDTLATLITHQKEDLTFFAPLVQDYRAGFPKSIPGSI